MGRLAEALDVSVASATGIVSRMTARGVIERRQTRRIGGSCSSSLPRVAPGSSRTWSSTTERGWLGCSTLLSEEELAGFLLGLRSLHAARVRLPETPLDWAETEPDAYDPPGRAAVPAAVPAPIAASTAAGQEPAR